MWKHATKLAGSKWTKGVCFWFLPNVWLVKLWKSFLNHVDIESLQGLEKQLDKLIEEKPTKADLCVVPQVAQGVTKLSTELGQ